jgi:branched-chain amino acid transport system ATP-binding protein
MTEAGEASLRLVDVARSFGGIAAVDGVTFTVEPGEQFGVIGPNGAGKTSLLNCVNGIYPIDRGETWLGGQRIDKLRVHQITARGIARTFQGAGIFPDFKVVDYLLLGRLRFTRNSVLGASLALPGVRRAESRERDHVLALLDEFGLTRLRAAQVGDLPYGTRKVLDVVRALAMEPKVLLLDEPTSGTTSADRERLREVVTGIRAKGVTTLIVDHDVAFISGTCDRVLAMNFGRQLSIGTPSQVLSTPEVRAAYLGT